MGLIMMLLLSTLIACQVMDNPGHVFTSVAIAEETDKVDSDSQETQTEASDKSVDKNEDKDVDPLFEDPQEEVIQMGVEPPADPVETVAPSVATVVEGRAKLLPKRLMYPMQYLLRNLRLHLHRSDLLPLKMVGGNVDWNTHGWANPRAILAMPNGEEKVVKAGDMLSDDGVVVMTIGNKFIELAVLIRSTGRDRHRSKI